MLELGIFPTYTAPVQNKLGCNKISSSRIGGVTPCVQVDLSCSRLRGWQSEAVLLKRQLKQLWSTSSSYSLSVCAVVFSVWA